MDSLCVIRLVSPRKLSYVRRPGDKVTSSERGFIAMTATETQTGHDTHQPVDAVMERLNDPAIAASLVTLLDNAELLSTLVLGLSEFIERGDVIMDAIAGGVAEFKASGGPLSDANELSTFREAAAVARQAAASAPLLAQILDSSMARPETVQLLSDVSDAATEGVARARANDTRVTGALAALKTLKDPEVQRGLGVVVEISRSLGRRMGQAG